ncbi:phage tail protein [Sulfurimonas sp. NWX79]|uniref:phage tail protein n=1 Tax=Campylobacterales TaxID=213849 RepID=UPI003204E969|nr:tail-collar fiber protein [Sulfurimonas phage SNW-1]
MAFYTILTDIGKEKLANATALGTVVSLTEIAVGDGGGVSVQPATTDTALINEVWRAALNNISIDSSNANWVVCEGYIPSTDGDFTVREVGLFDVDGDMIAVGNYPDTYKPTLASGSAKDLYIKVIIEVSDAGVVELKIDPAVVLSTRKYVDDEVAKRALLQGDKTKTFKVGDAVNADEAVSKAQLDSKPTGYKNLLINPNGLINQRGYVSGTATVADNEYTLDRWRVVTSGEALTFSTTDNVTTFTAPLNGVEQIIENINLIGGDYILTFNGTATATISQSSDNVTYTSVTANTDGSYTLTGGLYTKVTLTNGTFSLPQLEQGKVGTPFEQRTTCLELTLCQRYYETGRGWLEDGDSSNGNVHVGNANYKVSKRVAATWWNGTLYHVNGGTSRSGTLNPSDDINGGYVHGYFTSDSGYSYWFDWTADAEL